MKIADVYIESSGVYRRPGANVQFEYNDGDATEEYILNVVKNASDLQTASEELSQHIRDWPTSYHFSPQRADLLRPFVSFFHNKKILEIGCGCGALTRFLGESGADVIALEGSLRRATITSLRCRDLANVKVVCDNFDQFESSEQFDIIIIVGVLEYSGMFMRDRDPYKKMLASTAALLKPDGVIMLAIENKLGLKYWAGMPEDHTGKPYDGIENRYTADSAVTFGKQELDDLLNSCGFVHKEFYFPFPDYKLPSIILREKSLHTDGFNLSNLLATYFDYQEGTRQYPAFMMQRAWKGIIHNKLTDQFSNSFFVVAGRLPHTVIDDNILGYTYSSRRKPAFNKENAFVIEDGKIVVRRKSTNNSTDDQQQLTIIHHMPVEDYLPGDIYFLKFSDIISTTGWSVNDLANWALPYYELLLRLSEKKDDHLLLDGKYADITPFNILVDGGQLHFFDQEWEVREKLPLSYIFVRGLYYSIGRPNYFYPAAAGTPVTAFALIKEVAGRFFSATGDKLKDFVDRESKYFGCISPVENYAPGDFKLQFIPEKIVSGKKTDTGPLSLSLQSIKAKVFYQTETRPFSEANSASLQLSLTDQRQLYSIRFNAPAEPILKLRVDLAEQPGAIKFYSLAIKDDKQDNLFSWDGAYPDPFVALNNISLIPIVPGCSVLFFLSDDPMIIFTLPEKFHDIESSSFTIEINLAIAESEDIFQMSWLAATDMNNRLNRTSQKAAENENFIHILDSQIDEQKNSIRELERATQNLNTENAALKEYINTLKGHVEWYRATYEFRSFPGLVKDRLTRKMKTIYAGILDKLLSKPFIQNKYATAYMLQYARDHGIRQSFAAIRRSFKKNGLKTITDARSLLLAEWRKQSNGNKQTQSIYREEVYQVEDLKEAIKHFAWQPKISVIIPTYNTKPGLLEMAIDSVRNQVYEHWELCIVDDGSTSRSTKKILRSYTGDDRVRIRFMEKNGGISTASNAAIALATGQYIALFDHDDELTPDALYWVAKEINEHPRADIIYTDECKVDEDGNLSDFFLKPDWSPELLLNMMYSGHLTVYRKAFLDNEVGYFRSRYDFSQDYDLMLRAVEHTGHIRHIKRVLYRWRITAGSATMGDKPYARQTNLAALADAVARRGIAGDIIELPIANRVKLQVDQRILVSVIIPTDSYNNLKATIESIRANTSYPNYEIVAVTNSGLIATMQGEILIPNIVYVPYDLPYNFSDKCNLGATWANGEIVIFFNDDVRPLQSDWIGNTIEFLSVPGVGGVSPKLIYEDDTIQYAGMATGVRNLVGTTFHACPKDSLSYFNFPQLVRDISVLSGACLAMKKDVFFNLGGFDAVNTPNAHSDVDLSFKILDSGLRCVYTPYANLRHIGHLASGEYEKKNKKLKKDKSDIYLLRRWIKYLSEDSYFTTPMRDLLYHDSPEPMKLYGPSTDIEFGNKGDIILVCHDLTLSGAPIMLYNICKILVTGGYFVVVFCEKDGPLRQMYQALGVTVIVDTLLLRQHQSFYQFAINFDYIICNTTVTWPVVKQMQQSVKTIWWLHEAKVIGSFTANKDFVSTLRQAKNLIGVSDYALSYISKYNRNCSKIYNACEDYYEQGWYNTNGHTKDKIILSIVGSIEPRKGHDILFESLSYLPADLVGKIEIRVVGRTHDPDFKKEILKKIEGRDNIVFIGEISNHEAIRQIAGADIIVCPSRDDPFPVILVEAFCLAKTCISSDCTGFAELIHDGENGFVFKNEDAKALADKIIFICDHIGQLGQFGLGARKVYKQQLTMPRLEKNFISYLKAGEPKPGGDAQPADQKVTVSAG